MNETIYYITAEERTWVEDPGEPDADRYDWHGGSGLDVRLTGIYASEPASERWGWWTASNRSYDSVYGVEEIAAGDPAYVLVVRYRGGDTFGYSGYWTPAGVFATREAAEAARHRAEGENDTDSAYRPWDGYFESLTEARIDELVMRP